MWSHGAGGAAPLGLVADSGDLGAKFERLVRLARRVQRHPTQVGTIPAGFTYLAQVMAHDLTVPTQAPGPDISAARTAPLQLDTMYGGGPTASPMLYEINLVPGSTQWRRTGRLRLGLTRGGTAPVAEARDIPRLGCPVATRFGHPQETAIGWPCPADAPQHPISPTSRLAATEALLADPRNDDNLLVSQNLAVFLRLHNWHYDIALGPTVAPTDAQILAAFATARARTTALYRRILRSDLLPRLLAPDTWVDAPAAAVPAEVPAVLKHGALRVCHSMIADTYILQNESRPIREFLQRTSSRGAGRLPLEASWVIDWERFFDGAAGMAVANKARRLGPSISLALADSLPFDDNEASGLSHAKLGLSLLLHDYLRAEQTITGGFDAIWTQHHARLPSGKLFQDRAKASIEIATWLRHDNTGGGGVPPLSEADIAVLSKSGPVPFMLAFEAMRDQEGKCFGPLGSAVITTTLAPLLAPASDPVDTGPTRAISKMADLIAHLVHPQPVLTS